jgi:hypothetical protein
MQLIKILPKFALITAILFTLLLLLSRNLFAANFYFAQSQAGTADGSSCANAMSSNGNWSAVASGDTVYLCGNFSSKVTIAQGDITVKSCKDGEANCGSGNAARFLAPYWPTAISANNLSNLTIDGNGVGVIRATDNGDASQYSNQEVSRGIFAYNCSNLEIKGWTIENIYMQPYGVTPSPAGGMAGTGTLGIYVLNGSNISVQDNLIYDAGSGIIYSNTSGATKSDIYLFNNTVYNCNWGVQAIGGGSGTLTDNVNIYGNDITIGANWITTTNVYHLNGSYNFSVSGASMSNLHFYNNYIHGPSNPPGPWTCSGFFWHSVESPGTISGVKAYNNLMVGVSGDPANVYIAAKGDDAEVFNNTVIGYYNTVNPDYGTAVFGIKASDCNGSACPRIENNVLKHLYIGIYRGGSSGSSFTGSDFNSFHDNGYDVVTFDGANHYYSVAQWQSANGGCPGTGYDCGSITIEPDLTGTYRPYSKNSPLIYAGANLSGLGISTLNIDKAGKLRPATGPWDIGVYQYAGEKASPTNLRFGK